MSQNFSLPVDISQKVRGSRLKDIAPIFRENGCKPESKVRLKKGDDLEEISFGQVPEDAIYTGSGVAMKPTKFFGLPIDKSPVRSAVFKIDT
jgi:hypothetical protein